jgi:hypothetical protein
MEEPSVTGHSEKDDELSAAGESGMAVPRWFRAVVGLLGLGLLVPSVIYIARYTYEPDRFVKPDELDLPFLIVTGALLTLAAMTPWRSLGLRISKVGFVEFQQVVKAQAREHTEDFAEILERVEELEQKARGIGSTAAITEHFAEIDLYPLLLRFLKEHAPTAFSPVRIQQWGARQPGYEKFGQYSQGTIRVLLHKMVSQGVAATTVSKLGSTLFRAVR